MAFGGVGGLGSSVLRGFARLSPSDGPRVGNTSPALGSSRPHETNRQHGAPATGSGRLGRSRGAPSPPSQRMPKSGRLLKAAPWQAARERVEGGRGGG